MTEPNPYEPPRELEPLTRGQVVKRSVGVAAIILLTPPAMVIAVLVSCNSNWLSGVRFSTLAMIAIPLATLTALMVLAAVINGPRRRDSNRSGSRVDIFLATPLVVGVAMAMAFVVALVISAAGIDVLLKSSVPAILVSDVVFWVIVSAALLVMLWRAWRAG